MRIAISSEDKNGLESAVSHHFGRCPYYVLVDVEGQEIHSFQAMENPYARQHQPGMVPSFIRSQGVDVMLSGGMGRRAIELFQQFGIQIATGAMGTVQQALQNFLNGELRDAAPCREQEGKHGHHRQEFE